MLRRLFLETTTKQPSIDFRTNKKSLSAIERKKCYEEIFHKTTIYGLAKLILLIEGILISDKVNNIMTATYFR